MSASAFALPKIENIRSEIHHILKSLIDLQFTESKTDSRTYTSYDIIEALQLTERVLVERLNDGIDEWARDHTAPNRNKLLDPKYDQLPFRLKLNLPYGWLFTSIEEQIKETIENEFSDGDGKMYRFVPTFNNMLTDRLITWMQMIGPTGSRDMASFIIQALIQFVENYDPEQTNLDEVRAGLSTIRKNNIRKIATETRSSENARLSMIRRMFEERQESAAA
jgi:hypothetical protein